MICAKDKRLWSITILFSYIEIAFFRFLVFETEFIADFRTN